MKQLRQYLIVVFLLSVPFWILGYVLDGTKIIPVKLPASALQFLCALLAAIIVTKWSDSSAAAILKRGLDFHRIKIKLWRYLIFILMPLTILFSCLLMQLNGIELPSKMTPIWSLPIFLLVYGISGYSEELGWTAIATDKLLIKFNVVFTGIIVGFIWVVWHIIPFLHTHNSANWIFWQCTFTIVYRVLLTKIYVVTNRSVFATITLHATYNTAFSMMPYYGSSYNPKYMVLATSIVGIIIFYLCRSKHSIR